MLLNGKVAIASGAIAAALAREGAKVVINHDAGADAAFHGGAPAREAFGKH